MSKENIQSELDFTEQEDKLSQVFIDTNKITGSENYKSNLYRNSLPKGWEVVKIKDIGKITSGTTPLRSNMSYHTNGTIPWVKTTDLNNSLITLTEEKITEQALKETSLRLYPKGTVLVAMYGGFNQIGRTGILAIEATVNQALSAISVDVNEVEPMYLLYWLNAKVGLWKNLAGSSRKDPNITSKDVGDFPFLKIPLAEQKAITHTLGLMDAAIYANNQLITQKELRKKWLMQNLLTGKKRLKGYKDEWAEYTLEYFIEEYCEKSNASQSYEVLTSAKVGLMKQTDYYGDNRITNREDADYNVIPPNYLTYRSRSDDGLFTFNKNNLGITGLISGYYPVFDIKNGDADFILMYCNFNRYSFRKYSIGTSQLVLSIKALKSAVFKLPIKEEQIAIAKIFQAAEKEIQLLKAKTERLKEQKKGVMQVLLTGKKRLKLNN
jgi:type I restriction enzyme S subunit